MKTIPLPESGLGYTCGCSELSSKTVILLLPKIGPGGEEFQEGSCPLCQTLYTTREEDIKEKF